MLKLHHTNMTNNMNKASFPKISTELLLMYSLYVLMLSSFQVSIRHFLMKDANRQDWFIFMVSFMLILQGNIFVIQVVHL